MRGYRSKTAAVILAVAGLCLLVGCFVVSFLPVGNDYVTGALKWMQGLGAWASPMLVVAYVLAAIFFIPSLLLSIGAGSLFGLGWGVATVSVGGTLGACAAFLLGRKLLRRRVQAMTVGDARISALDRAVGREGFKIVLLTRLSPFLPYNLLNYAFGLTPIRFQDFTLATFLGKLPGTLFYVYLGSTLADLADISAASPRTAVGWTLLTALGLLATLAVLVFLTRIARRTLRDAMNAHDAGPTAGPAHELVREAGSKG